MTRPLDPVTIPLDGAHLIEASAGTGKTYTIATLFVRLLVERDLAVDDILVVTFTEAAAAELRDRIRTRLRAALAAYADPAAADPILGVLAERRREHADRDMKRLALALRGFDEAAISTIHGFCSRVLHDSAFETGVAFDTELILDTEPLVDQVVRDFWSGELFDADPHLVGHLEAKRLGPRKLVQLARVALAHPRAPITPEPTLSEDDPDVAAFVGAFERAHRIWQRDRLEVQAMLVGAEGLKRNIYKPDAWPDLFQTIDAFLRDARPGSALTFPGLRKLCPDSLAAGSKKAHVESGDVPHHAFFEACAELERASAPLLLDLEARLLDLRRRAIAWTRRELPRRKRTLGVQSFDDLLQDLARALRGKGGARIASVVRERHRAALIDEFQDTDPIQYEIFRSIYAGTRLPVFLIGDPKQAIYGFRGADVFAYVQAAAAIGDARHTMDTNWRSDPELIDAVEHLFDVPRPFMLEEIGFPRVAPRPGAEPGLRKGGQPVPAFEILFARRDHAKTAGSGKSTRRPPTIARDWAEEQVPELVAAHISELLADGAEIREGDGWRPVHAGDIAVLVRKNAQAQQVQRALRRLGIPGVVYGDASVYATPEAEELQRVLAAVAEPTHSAFIRAAVTTEMLGVTGDELHSMTEDDTAWGGWVEAFRRWHGLWVDRGFIQMFRALLVDSGAQRRLLALLDGERRMTNLLHLAELLHTAASREHFGPAGLLRWFHQERTVDFALSEAAKLRLERDDQAVQLITIHRSKGLEYPIVLCPYAWDADELRRDEDHVLLHNPEHGNRLEIDIGPRGNGRGREEDPAVARARFELAAESLRLLYVAVTRARHRCMLVWGAFDRFHHSALGYLLHAPQVQDSDGSDREAIDRRIREADDEELLAWLERRKAPSWTLRFLDEVSPRPYTPERLSEVVSAAREPRARLDRLWRTASFTQMTRGHDHGASLRLDAALGRDRDEVLRKESVAEPDHGSEDRVPLSTFPRGARAGIFFHDVLEHLDFEAAPDERRLLVESKLRAYGYTDPSWVELVDAAIADVVATPLGDAKTVGPRPLGELPRARRLDELEFVFPVASDDPSLVLRRETLARAFAEHPEGLPEGYADRVRALPFAPLRGFLKGFIDLCFVHAGRWYVVDYKTNHLGDAWCDYRPEVLSDVMADEHYVLQYHLYVVALVRHLRFRLPDFSYDRDFGGVLYLFLRGMSPARGIEVGVHTTRPSAARIEALERVLSGHPGPGGDA